MVALGGRLTYLIFVVNLSVAGMTVVVLIVVVASAHSSLMTLVLTLTLHTVVLAMSGSPHTLGPGSGLMKDILVLAVIKLGQLVLPTRDQETELCLLVLRYRTIKHGCLSDK